MGRRKPGREASTRAGGAAYGWLQVPVAQSADCGRNRLESEAIGRETARAGPSSPDSTLRRWSRRQPVAEVVAQRKYQLHCATTSASRALPLSAAAAEPPREPAPSRRAAQYGRRRSTLNRAAAPKTSEPANRIPDSSATTGQYRSPWITNGIHWRARLGSNAVVSAPTAGECSFHQAPISPAHGLPSRYTRLYTYMSLTE